MAYNSVMALATDDGSWNRRMIRKDLSHAVRDQYTGTNDGPARQRGIVDETIKI